MKSLLRSIVASPKNSHYDSTLGIQLDLSYITPQLIVCSGPTDNYWKSFYRYPVGDLVQFLQFNHGDKWKIWNFRSEDNGGYDDSYVYGKVYHYGFPDHQAPPLDILIKSCESINSFLTLSKNNVAVLHCKAGKGRSGTICCAYKMYTNHFIKNSSNSIHHEDKDEDKVESVINLYTKLRMKEFAGDGISIKSQRRYLYYWDKYLQSLDNINTEFLFTKPKGNYSFKIKVNGLSPELNNVFDLNLNIEAYNSNYEIARLSHIDNNTAILNEDGYSLELKQKLVLPSFDIRINFRSWCYGWFNILFEEGNNKILTWEDFDGFKGTMQKGSKLFESLEIHWDNPHSLQ
ncbi:protein tyrosine phosphatase [Scheffersomyces amazonensis]|uniref:protein tyrosine phosphatase n=1 Tax=Scheffersomyces amazonensis TaxID=1078765 RepID=UPI00315D4B9B